MAKQDENPTGVNVENTEVVFHDSDEEVAPITDKTSELLQLRVSVANLQEKHDTEVKILKTQAKDLKQQTRAKFDELEKSIEELKKSRKIFGPKVSSPTSDKSESALTETDLTEFQRIDQNVINEFTVLSQSVAEQISKIEKEYLSQETILEKLSENTRQNTEDIQKHAKSIGKAYENINEFEAIKKYNSESKILNNNFERELTELREAQNNQAFEIADMKVEGKSLMIQVNEYAGRTIIQGDSAASATEGPVNALTNVEKVVKQIGALEKNTHETFTKL